LTATVSPTWNYLWSNGATSNTTIVSPAISTQYCVTVTDINNCSNNACVEVIVEIPCGELFVPSGFSPNGDNENDELKVYGNCITELEILIFDRWGEKVFESTDVNASWDGTHKGKMLDNAVFVYYLNATVNGLKVKKHGNISLVK
jgi:gliding motility-associated-like protein